MKLRNCFSIPSIATFVVSGMSVMACSSDSQPSNPGETNLGGSATTGGQSSSASATGGASGLSTGGTPTSTGGAATSSTAAEATGGRVSTGGQGSVGGTKSSSTTGAGGTKATGGTAGIGGKTNGGSTGVGGKGVGGATVDGGATGLGGANATGGAKTTGGSAGVGGKGVGGTATQGGTKGAGGATGSGGSKGVGGTVGVGGTGTDAVGGNSSTSTQSTGYCPTSGPCKISPLGDSITEGMGWVPSGASTWGGGYRIKLFSQANTAGKNITFVGTRSNGPSSVDGKTFPKNHEGTSGISIEDLMNNVVGKGALTGTAVDPHIILLHIGTNNMYGTHSQTPEAYMAAILDKIIAACPKALLVVAKIIPYPGNTSGIDSLNSKIPALVQERAAKGAHIVMVDQFTGFDTGTQLSDGVHPNESGYTRMANVWYTAISQYLH